RLPAAATASQGVLRSHMARTGGVHRELFGTRRCLVSEAPDLGGPMDDSTQTPFPQPGYGPPAPAPRQGHRTRRVVAVAAATALVAGVGGVGAGYVVGRHFRGDAPTP